MAEEVSPVIVTDATPPDAPSAEPATPWLVSTEAQLVEVPSAPTDADPNADPNAPPAAEPEYVQLTREEHRRLMGFQGGLNSLQQQFQGIKAEKAALEREVQETRRIREQWERQQQQATANTTVQQTLGSLRQSLAERLNLSDEEWEAGVMPVAGPLVQEIVRLREENSRARLVTARAEGLQWLSATMPRVIQDVTNEYAQLGIAVTLTPSDLEALGATVETVRDDVHLRMIAEQAAKQKALAVKNAPPAPNPLQTATGYPQGPWPLAPGGGGTGAISSQSLRQQYRDGQISLQQFRDGMARAPKDERDLFPSLFTS